MLRNCKYCIFLLSLLCLQQVPLRLAASKLHCEMLPAEECAFAVDSLGKRCVLQENNTGGLRAKFLSCGTSSIFVGDESPTEYIENEQCMKACGVEKMTVEFSAITNLSKDSFFPKLCSRDCRYNCPNLVDLYSTIDMLVGRQGELTTYADFCGEYMHTSSEIIRLSQRFSF